MKNLKNKKWNIADASIYVGFYNFNAFQFKSHMYFVLILSN